MNTLQLRRAVLRFYPTLIALSLITQRALAREDEATDAAAPKIEVVADEFVIPGVRFHVAVDPPAEAREVHAYVIGVSKRPVRLKRDAASGLYEGSLRIPDWLDRDLVTLRIVVRDKASKRITEEVRVPVLADPCCEDEETCGLLPQVIEEVERAAREERS